MANSDRKENKKSLAQLSTQNEDFIPYSFFYNKNTVVTKNSQILQTIKITGFHAEILDEMVDLRKLIRDTLSEHVDTPEYAIWLQTIRTKKDLSLKGKYENVFASELDAAWVNTNNWDNKYVNELYLTIIRESSTAEEEKKVKKSLSFLLMSKKQTALLDKAVAELEIVVSAVFDKLKTYGAKRLGMFKKDDIYYTQFARFIGKIINFEALNRPVIDEDLSTYIPTSRVAFGGDTYQVQTTKGENHFGAIFTVKEYSELSGVLLDKFLQLEQEFIITQTFNLVTKELALKNYKEQIDTLSIGENKRFIKSLGLDQIIEDAEKDLVRFGQNQITINFFADAKEKLEEDLERAVKALNNFGLVAVRENVFLESCYWSQLPANFFYVLRKSIIDLSQFAGFSSLYNHPAGNVKAKPWGEAITLLYTKEKLPYFFNFHNNMNGHTLIVGPSGCGKTILQNFLISQSLKHDIRVFCADFYGVSELFVEALDGHYEDFGEDDEFVSFNPFSLDDTAENREFLNEFLGLMTISKTEISDGKYQIATEKKDFFHDVIDELYQLPSSQRHIKFIAEKLVDTDYQELFEKWVGDGDFARIFDNEEDDFAKYQDCFAVDFTILEKKKTIMVPFLAYFLHKVRLSLDGKPTIIVLNQAWKLIDNVFFASKIKPLLEEAKQKNAIVIFTSDSYEEVHKSGISKDVLSLLETKFYFPYADLNSEIIASLNLDEEESKQLVEMNPDTYNVMLKNSSESVILNINLNELEHVLGILSANDYSLEIKEKVQGKVGKKAEDWVPVYFEVFKEIMQIDKSERDFQRAIEDIDLDNYQNRASFEAMEEVSKNIAVNKTEIINNPDDE